jgi:hypothetical protein
MTAILLAAMLPQEATPVPCKATTDVPEFEIQIAKACAPGLVSIDLSGDHDTLTETLVLDKDFGGRDLSETVAPGGGMDGMTQATLHGFRAAMESAKIIEPHYATKKFIWRVRDRKGRPICHFTVTDSETTGRCAEAP